MRYRQSKALKACCALAGAAILLLAPGCSKSKSNPAAPQAPAAPTPDSPTAAVDLLEWIWEQRALAQYGPLLTADFAFVFDPSDTTGNSFPDRSLTRMQELAAAEGLFSTGNGPLPAASGATLDLNSPLTALPDSRPGKAAGWHRQVDSRFDLTMEFETTTYRAVGGVRFFLVRGDSANLPATGIERAAAGDSMRWYLERWEEYPSFFAAADGRPRAGGASPQPTRATTWGQLKLLYLLPPAAASRVAGATRGGDPSRGARP